MGQVVTPEDCMPLIGTETIRRLAEAHLDRLAAIDGRKSPRGSWTRCRRTTCSSACSRILFPRATFIHCRRDLRDVAVSCWMTDFSSIRWANDPSHIAGRFRQYLPDHGPLAHRSAGRDPRS